jgi:PAS domain S-box-containing protein
MTADQTRLMKAWAHAVDAVLVIDGHGVLQLVSPSASTIFGYEPDVVIGTNGLDLVHPDDMALTVEALAEAASATGRQEPLALRVQDADGRWRPVTLVAVNRLDDPEVAGIVLTVRDATGLADQERIVAEREDRYRQIVELAAGGVWMVDAHGSTTFVTGRMAAMLGYAVDEMIGHSMYDFMDDEGRADAADRLDRGRLGISEEYPFRLVHRDGSSVWTRVAQTPIVGRDGEFVGIISMLSDVSALHRAQERLAASEATHRAILDAIPDLVFRLSADGTYLGYHAGRFDTLIDDPTAYVGRNIADVLPTDMATRAQAAIDGALASGAVITYEVRVVADRPLTYETRIAPVGRDEVVALVRDITDRRLADDARIEQPPVRSKP